MGVTRVPVNDLDFLLSVSLSASSTPGFYDLSGSDTHFTVIYSY